MIDNEALKSIEKLHELKTAGIVSEEEFELAKKGLLEGKQRPSSASPTTSKAAQLPALDNHIGWMILPLRRYAQFEGRSGRREFWMFLLLTNVVAAALGFIVIADTNFLGYTGTLGNLAFGVLMLGILAVLVPLIACEVRRFHDQGKSGWYALLNIIPYLGAFVVLILMLQPGTDGENQYGPDPHA